MIRDPSDGSVREPAKPEVSGLAPEDQATKDTAKRLQASRDWLKNYLKPKHHADLEEHIDNGFSPGSI